MKLFVLIAATVCLIYACQTPKKTAKNPPPPISGTTLPKDTSKKADSTKPIRPNTPKSFTEVITPQAISDTGIFNIYKQADKYFMEIADSLLERDILIVSRISKSAAENRNPMNMLGYGGDHINDQVIRFDKGPNNKLFMRKTSFAERGGDSTAIMYKSVLNSNIQPIVGAFDIKAFSKNNKGIIIDISDYLNNDNDIFFFDGNTKSALRLGPIQPDRSYIMQVNAYPSNIEIKTIKTYSKSAQPAGPGMAPAPGGFATYELNTSIILLPEQQMRPRNFDPRVGYFTTSYTDFSSNPTGIEKVSLITRWRLEPKKEDVAKYLKGELVEPQKPIIFYIDPATPKKWVPYLIDGVNDWKIAFEKAGFKNAIIAREAPTKQEDSTWSIDDARNSAIVYKPSDIPNASGPHIHDPRTGEILETHINWYHNVMKLLRNWYFIQASINDPRARTTQFNDTLMGQLIRFVSSHEVGHTLGLRHNFGSSSTVPVEKLRDKKWVEENGHTPSIMDYARFNYVAQPEDLISEKGIYPRIGDYDKWAIEWGYRWYPEKTKEEEKAFLNKWIIKELNNNKQLWFGTEMDQNDPRCQNEDLGDNAMLAGTYGIKNLKRIVPNILEWSKQPNEGYKDAEELYGELLGQFGTYMGHVAKNIAGIMTTPKSVEQPGDVIVYVSKTKQKEALAFLNKQLFTTPLWLIDKNILAKTRFTAPNIILGRQEPVLLRLLSAGTFTKLLNAEAIDNKAYKSVDYLSDLKNGIFSELASGKSIDIYRRNLQKAFVTNLIALISSGAPAGTQIIIGGGPSGPNPAKSDISSIARAQLSALKNELATASTKTAYKMTRYHLIDLVERIKTALDPR